MDKNLVNPQITQIFTDLINVGERNPKIFPLPLWERIKVRGKFIMKNHLKLNLLYLLIFIITLYGCGSEMNTPSNDTGSLSFALKWETPSNIPLTKTSDISSPLVGEGKGEGGFNTQNSELSYAPIDCTAIGVSTVSANVYDSGGTYITSGGPWNCADHSGTITGISAGINRMIAVSGKDSSNRIIYNGQITGVTIDKDQTTNAGTITMLYVANDTTAPTDGTISASAGNSQVSLSWSGFTDSGSGLGSYKLVYSTTTTPSSCSSGTQIWTGTGTSYTHTSLTNGTTYYYRVCATDNAGNTSSGTTASGIPASSGGTTTTGGTTTSDTAPSAPTGVSASAGNGQVTISWSSVSGATSNVYWSTTSGVTKTTGTKITGATSPYTHTGRTNGTTYYYVVTAVNSYGESSESSQVSAIPVARTVKVLVVAGGGAGGYNLSGSNSPGGGGGGGLIYNASYEVGVGSYSITVGSGGVRGSWVSVSGNGSDSSFGSITAKGGGYGGGGYDMNGANGGSGGGGRSYSLLYGSGTGGSGIIGQGNNGGNGHTDQSGGGGGGAGAAGGNGGIDFGGNGGNGFQYDISGSNLYYAGGGGGRGNGPSGSNGLCDSGYGCGSMGFIGDNNNLYGNPGTQGVVIIRYATGSINATISGGCTRSFVGGDTVDTFTSNGTWTVN